jgi:8-hydroxy-5-deazaflavin:NADPH oxidoreductase
VPSAQGYRAFNSVGWDNMADPRLGDTTTDLFYAGPVDQRAADALATLWFALAFGQQRGRRLAFRLPADISDFTS